MSQEAISEATRNAISSPVSAAGRMRSGLRAYQTTIPFGQDHVRVSPSALQEREKEQKTNAISGLNSEGLSPSAILQRSLENRLRQRMAAYGSLEYALTWKHWDMPLGEPICALRASVRRTSDKGCTGLAGWVSPTAQDHSRGVKPPRPQDKGIPLSQQVGMIISSSSAPTEKRGALNPDLCRWLMGYPIEWGLYGAMVMPSSRKSRKCS